MRKIHAENLSSGRQLSSDSNALPKRFLREVLCQFLLAKHAGEERVDGTLVSPHQLEIRLLEALARLPYGR